LRGVYGLLQLVNTTNTPVYTIDGVITEFALYNSYIQGNGTAPFIDVINGGFLAFYVKGGGFIAGTSKALHGDGTAFILPFMEDGSQFFPGTIATEIGSEIDFF